MEDIPQQKETEIEKLIQERIGNEDAIGDLNGIEREVKGEIGDIEKEGKQGLIKRNWKRIVTLGIVFGALGYSGKRIYDINHDDKRPTVPIKEPATNATAQTNRYVTIASNAVVSHLATGKTNLSPTVVPKPPETPTNNPPTTTMVAPTNLAQPATTTIETTNKTLSVVITPPTTPEKKTNVLSSPATEEDSKKLIEAQAEINKLSNATVKAEQKLEKEKKIREDLEKKYSATTNTATKIGSAPEKETYQEKIERIGKRLQERAKARSEGRDSTWIKEHLPLSSDEVSMYNLRR